MRGIHFGSTTLPSAEFICSILTKQLQGLAFALKLGLMALPLNCPCSKESDIESADGSESDIRQFGVALKKKDMFILVQLLRALWTVASECHPVQNGWSVCTERCLSGPETNSPSACPKTDL